MVLGSNLGREKDFSYLGQGSMVHSDNSTSCVVLGSNLGRDKSLFSYLGHGSMDHIVTILLVVWSWVQIFVGTNDFFHTWGGVAWFK